MKRVLILCTGNSCRSQIAEGFWRNLGGDNWTVASAGSKPAGFVHPFAVQVMKEAGIDLSQNTSKSVDEYRNQQFDIVVTVCDQAKESCPIFLGASSLLHWPFEDPAAVEGTDDEKLLGFRKVRDQIQRRIAEWAI